MTIKIPDYRVQSRNKTNRKHWSAYMNQKKEVGQLVGAYTNYKKFDPISPARVTITAYFKGVKSIDTSNIDDKLYIDVLQEVGLLKDDNPTENPEVIKRAFCLAGKNEVVIEVNQQ